MTQSELIAELVKALEPFADEAGYYDPQEQDGKILDDDYITDDGNGIRVGDFRRAREALSHARAVQSDEWQLGDADEADVEFYCTPGTRPSCTWFWREDKFRPYSSLHTIPTFVVPTHWRPLPSPPSKQEGE